MPPFCSSGNSPYASVTMTKCPLGAVSNGTTRDPGGRLNSTSPGPGKIRLFLFMSRIARLDLRLSNPMSPGRFAPVPSTMGDVMLCSWTSSVVLNAMGRLSLKFASCEPLPTPATWSYDFMRSCVGGCPASIARMVARRASMDPMRLVQAPGSMIQLMRPSCSCVVEWKTSRLVGHHGCAIVALLLPDTE